MQVTRSTIQAAVQLAGVDLPKTGTYGRKVWSNRGANGGLGVKFLGLKTEPTESQKDFIATFLEKQYPGSKAKVRLTNTPWGSVWDGLRVTVSLPKQKPLDA